MSKLPSVSPELPTQVQQRSYKSKQSVSIPNQQDVISPEMPSRVQQRSYKSMQTLSKLPSVSSPEISSLQQTKVDENNQPSFMSKLFGFDTTKKQVMTPNVEKEEPRDAYKSFFK
jgi:hypothetical protein